MVASGRRRAISAAIERAWRSSPSSRIVASSRFAGHSLTTSSALSGWRGVHAHVERRVVGVGEAALRGVELQRRDPEVHDHDVGPHPVGGEPLEHVGEVARLEARRAGQLGLELGEALGGRRVAVDRDQRPGRADALGGEPGVAAAAEGAVDHHLAGLRVGERDQLRGEDWEVLGRHVGQCGHRAQPDAAASSSARALGLVGELVGVRGPALGVPDLDVVADADHLARAAQVGVVDQVLGEPHAAGRVERLVGGGGVEAPVHHPALLAEPVEVGEKALRPVFITLRRVELDAGVEAGDENDPVGERPAPAGRDREPVLGVEVVVVLTAKGHLLGTMERGRSGPEWRGGRNLTTPAPGSTGWATLTHCVPLCNTMMVGDLNRSVGRTCYPARPRAFFPHCEAPSAPAGGG